MYNIYIIVIVLCDIINKFQSFNVKHTLVREKMAVTVMYFVRKKIVIVIVTY